MLDQFLLDKGAGAFVWGHNDCALFAGRWAEVITGLSAVRPFLGKYKTKRECDRFLAERGGLVAVFGAAALSVGLVPVDTARRGDVGVIRPGRFEICGICLGSLWAVKARTGVSANQVDVIQAWGLRNV